MQWPSQIELRTILEEIINELHVEYKLNKTNEKRVRLHCGTERWAVQIDEEPEPEVGFNRVVSETTIVYRNHTPQRVQTAIDQLLQNKDAETPRVFVVQNVFTATPDKSKLVPRYDLTQAKKFGEITFLLGPSARPFDSEPIISEIVDKLSTITPNDFILLIGNPCFIGYVVAIAASRCDGWVNLLQWHGMKKEYTHIRARLPVEEAL